MAMTAEAYSYITLTHMWGHVCAHTSYYNGGLSCSDEGHVIPWFEKEEGKMLN